jgi:hypothetical protein
MVEESVSQATWLPRVADFEGYTHLFDEGCYSPQSPGEMEVAEGVLMEKMNETNVSDELRSARATPVSPRKRTSDGTRKSARKSKPTMARLEGDLMKELETPTYKPRKSKYDV